MMQYNLPIGFTTRHATWDDAQIVTDMLNAEALATVGSTMFSLEECHQEWATPGLDLENSSVMVFSPDGRLAGYTEVDDLTTEMPVRPYIFGATHPDFWGMGIGSWMVHWSEQTLARAVQRVPNDVEVSMEATTFRHIQQGVQMFEDYGLRRKRSYFRMLIDLDEDVHSGQPIVPDGFQLTTLKEFGDVSAVYKAKDDGFKDHFGHVELPFEEGLNQFKHLISDEAADPEMLFILLDGDEIAGLIFNLLKSDEQPDIGMVHTLTVRRPWRKQGLGMFLLQQAFYAFQQRGGFKQVALQVDAESLTGATDLYLRAGMRVDRENVLYEKILQEGRNISTTGA